MRANQTVMRIFFAEMKSDIEKKRYIVERPSFRIFFHVIAKPLQALVASIVAMFSGVNENGQTRTARRGRSDENGQIRTARRERPDENGQRGQPDGHLDPVNLH